MNLHRLSILLLSFTAPFAVRATDGRIPVSQDQLPLTINASGHYYLTQDLLLTTPGTAAITVNAPDVDLDLNGHAITHTGTGTTYGIYIWNVNNVTIHNGSLNGASYLIHQDISAGASSNLRIAELRLLNNNGSVGFAIYVRAVAPGEISNLVIEHVAIRSGGAPSIAVDNVLAGRIAGNVIRNFGASYVGIYIKNSKAFEVSGNQITGGGFGITLDNTAAGSSGHTVARNTIQNGGAAINVTRSRGNLILQNTLANGGTGITIQTTSDGNVIENNTITGFTTGFSIPAAGGTRNIYVNNRWANNTTAVSIVAAGNQSGGGNCDGTVCN